MRPGHLYFSLFIWYVLSGGRFTAPFLKNVANFSDSMIGFTFSMQFFLGSLMGSLGAVAADSFEKKFPNKGRVAALGACIIIGSLSFEIHHIATFLTNENTSIFVHFIARMLFSVCAAITMPILDGIALAYLKRTGDQSSDYGKERLFGAVGWAIASLTIGPILDKYGFEIFFMSNVIGAGLAVIMLLIYLQRTTELYSVLSSNENIDSETAGEKEVEMIENNMTMIENTNEKTGSHTIYETLVITMRSWTSVGFLFSATTLCMGTSVVENLIFLFFEETLGGTNFQCGLTVVVTVIFEIPIFHYAPKILQAFGYQTMQKVACLAYITRVIGYTFIPKDKMYLVLFLEPLHGVTYACSKTATVQMASEITPEGYEASFQGIISMITSFGSVLGVCLGGWIEDHYSDILLYRLYAFIVFVGLVAYYASIAVTKNRNDV